MKTVKLSPGHQVYLPGEILAEVGIHAGDTFLVRGRAGIIELIPSAYAEHALDEGLENLRRASLAGFEQEWDNSTDEAWDNA